MARLEFPVVHLRIPIMGPKYMNVISILSEKTGTDDTLSDQSSWYMPDIDETVNFDHTIAIRSS